MKRKPRIKRRKIFVESAKIAPPDPEERPEIEEPETPQISVAGANPASKHGWEGAWISVLLVLAVFGAFYPALENGWIWDDTGNYVDNYRYQGYSLTHLKWIFTTTFPGHYQPLIWLTHVLDYQLWGMDPFGYHLGNIVFHAANTVLLYFLAIAFLQLKPDWQAPGLDLKFKLSCAAGALFFGLHPLRVESVAWITERRDVVSGFFYLLTLICYLKIFRKDGSRSTKMAAWALIFFLGSLMSKPWGITLPAILLILDVYPLRRFDAEKGWIRSVLKLLWEKIPYIVMAAGFAFVAVIAQEEWSIRTAGHGLMDRCIQAAYGLCFYPFKTLFPFGLSPLYILPHDFNPFVFKYLLTVFLTPALTIGLILKWRRWPWGITAWLCYAAIISPVLGLAQSGNQIAADRYSYLSCLPFSVLAAAGLYFLCARGRWRAGFAAAAAVLVILAVLTNLQTRVWKDRLSLWNHALKINPENYIAYDNRAPAYTASGQLDAAMADYDVAIRLNPDFADAYYGRGGVWEKKGNTKNALTDYNKAIELKPDFLSAYNNRGNIRQTLGDPDGALEDYSRAISLKNGFYFAYVNRGLLRKKLGDTPGAFADLDMAVKINPKYQDSFYNRGGLHESMGHQKEALRDYNSAIKLKPGYSAAILSRGNLLGEMGRHKAALEDYNRLIQIQPGKGDALLRRGQFFEKTGKLKYALSDYSEVIKNFPLNSQSYNLRGLLSLKMDESDGAMADYNRAIELNAKFISAYINRGTLRQVRQDLKGAMVDFNKAVELNPSYAKSYYNRGNLRLIQRETEKAIADYDRAISLKPDYANAYGNRGNARLRQEDPQGAVEDFKMALSIAPADWTNRKAIENLLNKTLKKLPTDSTE